MLLEFIMHGQQRHFSSLGAATQKNRELAGRPNMFILVRLTNHGVTCPLFCVCVARPGVATTVD